MQRGTTVQLEFGHFRQPKGCKTCLFIALYVLVLQAGSVMAETVLSARFGVNQITCPAASDTHLSVPFLRLPVRFSGVVEQVNGTDQGDVTLSPSIEVSWTSSEFVGSYYLRVLTGDLRGHWFDITENTESAVTVERSAVGDLQFKQGDRFIILRHWTLDSLFPPTEQTTIHESSGDLPFQQSTNVLLPDLNGEGIDLPAKWICYLTSEGWKQSAPEFPAAGDLVIPPGSTLIVRHPGGVENTVFMPNGQVLMQEDALLLYASHEAAQDNEVALHRPVASKLSESGLEAPAFQESAGHDAGTRADELLIFDNSATGFNKPAGQVFYRFEGAWYEDGGLGDANPVADDVLALQPATGMLIRKAPSSRGTATWLNTATYTE